VTIITVAFFAHWACSLISMQWYCCMGTLGNAVYSLLSAEERVSHYVFFLLMLPLSFNTVVTLLYSSVRAIYNKNKHKDIKN